MRRAMKWTWVELGEKARTGAAAAILVVVKVLQLATLLFSLPLHEYIHEGPSHVAHRLLFTGARVKF